MCWLAAFNIKNVVGVRFAAFSRFGQRMFQPSKTGRYDSHVLAIIDAAQASIIIDDSGIGFRRGIGRVHACDCRRGRAGSSTSNRSPWNPQRDCANRETILR